MATCVCETTLNMPNIKKWNKTTIVVFQHDVTHETKVGITSSKHDEL